MSDYTIEEYREAGRRAIAAGKPEVAEEIYRSAMRLQNQANADAARAAKTTDRGVVSESGYSGGAGAIRGATGAMDFMASVLPKINDFNQIAGHKIFTGAADLLGIDGPTQEPVLSQRSENTFRDLAAEKTGGYSEYKSPTRVGQLFGTIGEFGGGAAAMPFGGAATTPLKTAVKAAGPVREALRSFAPSLRGYGRSIRQSILPAVGSEAAGQMTEGSDYEDTARFAGSLLAAPVGTGLRAARRRMARGPSDNVFANVGGGKIQPATQTLLDQGIPVEAGQAVGSMHLMRLQDTVEPTLNQKAQLTRAALKKAGVQGDVLATDDVLSATNSRLGKVFDRADAVSSTIPTDDDGMRVLQALDDAVRNKSIGQVTDTLSDIADRISDAAGAKKLGAADINRTRRELRNALKLHAQENDQVNFELASDLLDTLDDMVERQIAKTDPDLLDELMQARKEYRAYLTIERAVNRQGSDAARGIITPNALASSVRTREGAALVRGTGTELADLAKAAQQVLTPAPHTAPDAFRNIPSAAKGLLDIAPSLAARIEGRSLARPTGGVLGEDLYRRLGAQAGGLLAID